MAARTFRKSDQRHHRVSRAPNKKYFTFAKKTFSCKKTNVFFSDGPPGQRSQRAFWSLKTGYGPNFDTSPALHHFI
jgi:hypothetical protein